MIARARRAGIDARVASLTRQQRGLVTRGQLAELGATRGVIEHRLRTGRWERAAPRVLAIGGTPPSWRRDLLSACLSWGAGAAVSHRAAAAVWQLDGFAPGMVELTVPRRRDRSGPGTVHRNLLTRADVTSVEGLSVTTPTRTLLDVASCAPRALVEEALDDALRRRLTSIPRVRWRLRELGGRGRSGTKMMRELLEARDPASPVPGSVFERRLLRVLRRSRLPEPALQHRIQAGKRTVAVVDLAFPDVRLAIEADGYRWHSGRVRWEHDRARRNALTLLGWSVVHVTWSDLEQRPQELANSIRDALGHALRHGGSRARRAPRHPGR